MVTRMAVGDAAAELTRAVTLAGLLITQPDTAPAATSGMATGSAPPWNAQAAAALFDAAEGSRRLEASLRRDVTGRTGRARGGSDANTLLAIAAVTALSEAVSEPEANLAARLMTRWAVAVERLPAVDTAEVWQQVRARCPYCGLGMLRACMNGERFGQVTCLRFGACFDRDNRHPVGRMDVNRVNGEGLVVWADGTTTP